jgi:hypothetical protein
MNGTTPKIHDRINVKPDTASITGTEADRREALLGHMHLRFRYTT